MIAPTVRQAIRIQLAHAVFEHATASQAVSSKARVPGMMTRHGTATTVGPWVGRVHPRRLGLQEHLDDCLNPDCAIGAGHTTGHTRTPCDRSDQRLAYCTSLTAGASPAPDLSGVILLEFDVLNHGALVDTQQRTK